MDPTHLLLLAETYATHVGRGLLTVATRAGVHNRTFVQLKKTGRCRTDTYARALVWFDQNWPADLGWPAGVSRPSARPARARRAA